jgi:hypothetical protein
MLLSLLPPALGCVRASSGCLSVLSSRLYHKNVVDHYSNPRNVGSFDKKDPNVGTGLVGECAAAAGHMRGWRQPHGGRVWVRGRTRQCGQRQRAAGKLAPS